MKHSYRFLKKQGKTLLSAALAVLPLTGCLASGSPTGEKKRTDIAAEIEKKKPVFNVPALKRPQLDSVTLKYYVSAGAVSGDGSLEKPFAQLSEARDALRAYKAENGGLPKGGAAVCVLSGEYKMKETFTLTEEDSGTADAPVYYVSLEKNGAMLYGGVKYDLSSMTEYAKNIYCIDMNKTGIEESFWNHLNPYGTTYWDREGKDGSNADFFLNKKRLKLARYPSDGYLLIDEVVDNGDMASYRGGTFSFSEDAAKHIEGWKNPADAWIGGLFFYDWNDSYTPLSALDTSAKTLTTRWPLPYGFRKNSRFFFFNVFEELNSEGEYYIDRENKKMYIYTEQPKESLCMESPEASFDLVSASGVSYVTFDGFSVSETRGCGIRFSPADHCTVANVNVTLTGSQAVVLEGYNNVLHSSDISHVGYNAVVVSGGDQLTQTPGNNLITNCVIHDVGEQIMSYASALDFGGVGNVATHNTLYNAPHQAIAYGGNDIIIEYNEIYDVCRECGDCGAIYTCGNYMGYGNILRYNYIHDVTGGTKPGASVSGQNAIYWDNVYSGQTAYGNLLVNISDYAFDIGGGRDETVYNNVIVNGKGFRYDSRAYDGIYRRDWYGNCLKPGKAEYEMFKKIPYQTGIWAEKYPNLARVRIDYEEAGEDDPDLAVNPSYSRIYNNVYYSTEKQQTLYAPRVEKMSDVELAKWYDTLSDFRNPECGDYTIKEDAQLFSDFPGFKTVDLTKVGADR